MTEHTMHLVSRDQPTVGISPAEYREAMRHFGGAVHVLTTDGDKGKRGVTISACCSLSDEPPTVLACLMRTNEQNRLFIENKHFCINTLAGHHQELSDVFAGRGKLDMPARFATTQWLTLKTGSPVLADALISLDCQLVSWHVHATHYVLIGEVVAVRHNPSVEGLIYLNRNYHTLPI